MRIALFLSLSFFTFAQALEFESSVDKTEVALNEPFTLNLEFRWDEDSSGDGNVSVPDIFNLKDFTFLSESQSQRSSLSIVNGQREFVRSFVKSYRLQAKAVGVFQLAPMRVEAFHQVFQSSAFEIQVVANRKKSQNPSQRTQPPSFMNPFFPSMPQFNLPDFFKDDFFDRTEPGDFKFILDLNKKTLYKGELLRADWLLLSTSKIPRFQSGPVPPPKGFWKEEVKNTNSHLGTKALGDTLYRKQLVSRLWLFPLRTGELKMEPHSIQVFSGFGFQNQVLSSLQKKIQVKELPLKGREINFTGAVGDFELDFSLSDTKDLKWNQPFSFKIVFKGSGHPRFIQLPYLPLGSSFKTYEPVLKSSFHPEGYGRKEFEILVISRKEGSVIFPSITLSTFDPQNSRYVFHKSPEFHLFIEKKPEVRTTQNSQTFFENPETDTTIKKDSTFKGEALLRFLNVKTLFFVLSLLSLVLLFFIFFKVLKKLLAKKNLSLHKKINKKIKQIEKKCNKKNLSQKESQQSVCVEMIDLLMLILNGFQAKTQASHWREALETLPPSLNLKYAKTLENLFKELEQLSFSSSQKQNTEDKVKALFKTIKAFRREVSSH